MNYLVLKKNNEMVLHQKILEIIPLLNNEDDSLLIGLLSDKISKIHQDKVDSFNSKHSITDYEFLKAKRGLERTLINFLHDQSDIARINKFNSIIRNNDCHNCRFSIVINNSRYADDTARCNRCNTKVDNLFDQVYELEQLPYKIATNLLDKKEYSDIIKCKAIVNKLNRKITKLKKEKS